MYKSLKIIVIGIVGFFLYTGLSVYFFSLENTEVRNDAAIVLGAAA